MRLFGEIMDEMRKFLASIYLGDRFCEKLEIGGGKIVFHINLISRLREGTQEWNYYSEKDIAHGCLVFDQVADYRFDRELPFNDEIYDIQVLEREKDLFSFMVSGCSVSKDAVSTDIALYIKARECYIFNPKNGEKIYK